MLSKKDKEEILRLRQEEDLTYDAIHEKTKFSINTIMSICREKAEENQKEEATSCSDDILSERKQEQIWQLFEGGEDISEIARKVNVDRKTVRTYLDKKYTTHETTGKGQEVHFDDPIEEIRAIPKTIDNIIKTEHLKADDRAEWEKRIEDIREILRIEVDDRIEGEREDTTKEENEIWQRCLKENYVKKEAATNLRNTLEEKDTTIKGLTKTIEEKDNLITNIKAENTNLNNENIGLNNENINLNEYNKQLEEYKEKYLEDAGRRERRRFEKERGDFVVENTKFEQYVREKQAYFREKEKDLNNKIREEGKLKKENTERKKELDEMQEKILNGISRAKNTLEEIERKQYWLDKEQEKLERLESVQSREKNVEWREKNIEKGKKLKPNGIKNFTGLQRGKVEGINFTKIVKLELA